MRCGSMLLTVHADGDEEAREARRLPMNGAREHGAHRPHRRRHHGQRHGGRHDRPGTTGGERDVISAEELRDGNTGGDGHERRG